MKKKLIKTMAASVLLAASAASFASPIPLALKDFTVTEGSVPGTTPHTITVDKITGNYSEIVTSAPTSLTTGTFVTKAVWDAGQFVKNDGTLPVSSFLGSVPELITQQYGLYAVFDSTGTYAVSGLETKFTGLAGTIRLYIDPSLNTTKLLGATGADPVTFGSNADDYEVLSASLLVAEGIQRTGLAKGDFNFIFEDVALTNDGKNFFTDPSPFYKFVQLAGQFNNIDVTINQKVNGSADAWFVPEPAGLALVGIALSGLGMFGRRRKS